MSEKIAVLGLGYVGLPLALALARKFPNVVGLDINQEKVAELRNGFDRNGEVSEAELKTTTLQITSDPDSLKGTTFFIVAVPTPTDGNRTPNLRPVIGATETVARFLTPGALVCYESTVYPGTTEELCAPILEKKSGLKRSQFKLGYSPERINPSDKVHTLETIVKIVSGEDQEALERVAAVYGAIIKAGLCKAPTIKTAEAAKVLENTQRDVNIALMNECSMIFERLGIRTKDVIEAAATKWNFLKFVPGLIGGHCISIDPYYLAMKAQQVGCPSDFILTARKINEQTPVFVAEKTVRMLINQGICPRDARVGILGMTFKENCNDVRNSKVAEVVNELKRYHINAIVNDPIANEGEVFHEYGIHLFPIEDMKNLDALIVAVSHDQYLALGTKALYGMINEGGVMVDVKSILDVGQIVAEQKERNIAYWSL